MKKRRRKLNVKKVLTHLIIPMLVILIVIVMLFNLFFPKMKSLGYSKEFIKAADNMGINTSFVTKYSSCLEDVVISNNYKSKNVETYVNIQIENDVNCSKSVNDLIKEGYKTDEITNIYSKLTEEKALELSKTDYISDINSYFKADYFISDNLIRYAKYKNSKDIDLDTAITLVNIGIDKEFYTNINKIKNPSNLLVLVNKYNQLPNDYVPSDLVTIPSTCAYADKQVKSEVLEKVMSLCKEINNMGSKFVVYSAYRSYETQERLYNSYVREDGVIEADIYSARAGHSEHQLGTTLDVSLDGKASSNIVESTSYDWLKNNAHKYGFIVRYKENEEHITGYKHEPWHLRYVGVAVATEIYEKQITLDEYYVKYVQNK
ncbi:MAG: D-alanyl-D-alanine carboxypeptidase family protein [Bacilli bacterium]